MTRKRKRIEVGDLVYDRADRRHVGRARTVARGGRGGDRASVRWLETGWLSEGLPLGDLRHAPKQKAPSEVFVMKRALALRIGAAR